MSDKTISEMMKNVLNEMQDTFQSLYDVTYSMGLSDLDAKKFMDNLNKNIVTKDMIYEFRYATSFSVEGVIGLTGLSFNDAVELNNEMQILLSDSVQI